MIIITVDIVVFLFLILSSVPPLTSVALCVLAGFQQLLLEPLFKFHHTLRKLGLQEEEYVLIQAMSLFSPGNNKSSFLFSTPNIWS